MNKIQKIKKVVFIIVICIIGLIVAFTITIHYIIYHPSDFIILSPQNEEVFHPGDVIKVVAQPKPDFNMKSLSVLSPLGIYTKDKPPFEINIPIEKDILTYAGNHLKPGALTLTMYAEYDVDKKGVPITELGIVDIKIEP